MAHQFGILDEIDPQTFFNDYTPQKYGCVSVHDEIVNDLAGKLSNMKTYFHSLSRPGQGLAYCGITIIPPESLAFFHDAVTTSDYFQHSGGLGELAAKIRQAMDAKKYMIHFGI